MCPTGQILSPSAPSSTTSFRPAFDVLDTDHDGKISQDDLRAFYSGFTSKGADEILIGSMIEAADLNKDGFVEYDEFELVLGTSGLNTNSSSSSSSSSSSLGLMEEVFKVMDKDGDGKLSHQDLKSYLNWAGFSASDEDINAMILLASGDNKDGVSYEGLLKILSLDS